MDQPSFLLWRDFERDLRVANKSPKTLKSYREAVFGLYEFHDGQVPLDKVSKDHVQSYILDQLDNWTVSTAANRFRSLRRFYNWAVDEDIIPDSPMARLKEPKGEGDEPPRDIPHIDDVRAVVAVCEPSRRPKHWRDHFTNVRDAAMLRLLCELGPRRAEIASMEVERVDMRTDRIGIKGKGNRWRTLPFSPKPGKALSRYLRVRAEHLDKKTSKWLWLSTQGSYITTSGIYQALQRRCEMAGRPRITPHQLRHFAVDNFFAHGGTEQQAMHIFGWLTPDMAFHYAKKHAGRRAVDAAQAMNLGDLI